MENHTEILENSMKISSAPTAPTTVAAASQELPARALAPTNPGDRQVARGGSGAQDDEGAPFTLVRRSKRGRALSPQKEAPETPVSLLPATPVFKDPFGLAHVEGHVNLVSMARTKLGPRRSTGAPIYTSSVACVCARLRL